VPFTLAHPAAVIPLRKPLGQLGVLGALVCGSVAPDVGYLTPWHIWPAPSHSFIGIFTFCLPVGLGLYGAFYLLVGPFLGALSPRSFLDRYPSTWTSGALPAHRLLAVAISIVVGAATHVVWDSFTHEGGVAVRLLPALRTPLFTWEGYTLYTFRVLQHSSTVLGLSLVAWWSLQWFRTRTPHASGAGPTARVRATLVVAIVSPALVVGLIRGWLAQDAVTGLMHRAQLFVARGTFAGGAVLLLCLLVVSSAWRIRLARQGA